MDFRCPNPIIEMPGGSVHRLLGGLRSLVLLVLLATCASPTETDVSIEAEMSLAPGEVLVLFIYSNSVQRFSVFGLGDPFPSHRQHASPASRVFAQCLGTKLAKSAAPYLRVMDTDYFQDAMFPWFEFEHAPQTAQQMDDLLSRPRIRERIASLNVHYLISMALGTDVEGFPGMFCGAGGGGAGCLGLAWAGKATQLDAIVWDLKTGREAGELSVSSSGTSWALGVIVPIIFIAYTEEDACEALAAELGEFLDSKTRNKTPDQ